MYSFCQNRKKENSMKKPLLIISLLLFFTILTKAQPREQASRPNFEKLKLELNLSEEQSEKFETLFKQKMKEMEGVREFFKEDRAAERNKMIEINDKYHKLFSEILDEEQLAALEKLTEERREEMTDRMKERKKR